MRPLAVASPDHVGHGAARGRRSPHDASRPPFSGADGVATGPRGCDARGVSTDAERFAAAALACDGSVHWHARRTPAEELAAWSALCDELGIDGWDTYGEGGAVERLEAEVAELLGKDAGIAFPSGIMAQQCALRVWCDAHGTRRVAIPDLAHPLVHEEDGPRRLHGFAFQHLTTGREVATAARLDAVPGRLGAVVAELPLRDAGCILPTWDELTGLAAAARQRGTPLHLDGARLWECQASYRRPHAEIAAQADSVYVSLYKGLGAPAGALVACGAGAADEVRLWRRRMGGTLYRMTPLALGGLVGMRRELPRMAEYLAWARAFAAALSAQGLRPFPQVPHISTFLVYADADADAVNARLIADMTSCGMQLSPRWRPADAPGTAVAEFAVYGAAQAHDPAAAAARLAAIVAG